MTFSEPTYVTNTTPKVEGNWSKFVNWCTTPTGEWWYYYNVGQMIKEANKIPNNMTLYAQWVSCLWSFAHAHMVKGIWTATSNVISRLYETEEEANDHNCSWVCNSTYRFNVEGTECVKVSYSCGYEQYQCVDDHGVISEVSGEFKNDKYSRYCGDSHCEKEVEVVDVYIECKINQEDCDGQLSIGWDFSSDVKYYINYGTVPFPIEVYTKLNYMVPGWWSYSTHTSGWLRHVIDEWGLGYDNHWSIEHIHEAATCNNWAFWKFEYASLSYDSKKTEKTVNYRWKRYNLHLSCNPTTTCDCFGVTKNVGEECEWYSVKEACDCPSKIKATCQSDGKWNSEIYQNCRSGVWCSCFPAWTQVTMADGSKKNIEDVREWEKVVSYNTSTNVNEASVVKQLIVHEDSEHELYELTINGNVLKVTDVHPFYVRKDSLSDTYYNWRVFRVRNVVFWQEYDWVEAQDLKVWDKLLMIDWSLVKIEKINHYHDEETVYNLEVEGNHDYFVDLWYLVHNKSCFLAGTQVTMADGTQKNIEDVKIWEKVLWSNWTINTVLAYDRHLLWERKVWSINGSEYFVSDEHPFKTTEWWKSFVPEKTKEELWWNIPELKVGDILVTSNGLEVLESFSSKEMDRDTPIYNFILDWDHTYHANNYLVHNKWWEWCRCADDGCESYWGAECTKDDKWDTFDCIANHWESEYHCEREHWWGWYWYWYWYWWGWYWWGWYWWWYWAERLICGWWPGTEPTNCDPYNGCQWDPGCCIANDMDEEWHVCRGAT